MSAITKASGGDGWSEWHVALLRSGTYEVTVWSKAVRNPDSTAQEVFHSEDITDGRRALDKALSESNLYAHRMAS